MIDSRHRQESGDYVFCTENASWERNIAGKYQNNFVTNWKKLYKRFQSMTQFMCNFIKCVQQTAQLTTDFLEVYPNLNVNLAWKHMHSMTKKAVNKRHLHNVDLSKGKSTVGVPKC